MWVLTPPRINKMMGNTLVLSSTHIRTRRVQLPQELAYLFNHVLFNNIFEKKKKMVTHTLPSKLNSYFKVMPYEYITGVKEANASYHCFHLVEAP